MIMIPRTPTEAMMQAGLYHCSHDMTWADLHTAFQAMFDAVLLDGGCTDQAPAELVPVRVVVALEGGLVQGVVADAPIDVTVVDYDKEGTDESERTDVPQYDGTTSEAIVSCWGPDGADIDAQWIDALDRARGEA